MEKHEAEGSPQPRKSTSIRLRERASTWSCIRIKELLKTKLKR